MYQCITDMSSNAPMVQLTFLFLLLLLLSPFPFPLCLGIVFLGRIQHSLPLLPDRRLAMLPALSKNNNRITNTSISSSSPSCPSCPSFPFSPSSPFLFHRPLRRRLPELPWPVSCRAASCWSTNSATDVHEMSDLLTGFNQSFILFQDYQ